MDAWGTWHKAGQACKCNGLCYEGRPAWFTWADQESARSKDYADPWAGARPANLNSNNLMMPMPGHPSVKPAITHVGRATMSPRIERLRKNRLASNILGPGNPRIHSNRRFVIPNIHRIPRPRPRMGIANPNIKPNRMINMHSRKMNPNLNYNSVMMPSGQEAG